MLRITGKKLHEIAKTANTLVALLEEILPKSTDVDKAILLESAAAIDRATVRITERYLHQQQRAA